MRQTGRQEGRAYGSRIPDEVFEGSRVHRDGFCMDGRAKRVFCLHCAARKSRETEFTKIYTFYGKLCMATGMISISIVEG